MFVPIWYVVTVGLDVGGEAGVLGDRRAVVVQQRELRGDVRMARHEDRRQDWRRTDEFFQDTATDFKMATVRRATHSVSPPSGSGRG